MAEKIRIGIYPGTFDPITKGHLHIIKRASRQVDRLIVGVAENARKNPVFTLAERIDMVRKDCGNLPDKACRIDVVPYSNLLVHFAQEQKATCIFRGLRAISDFDYEFQMTGMNARLAPDIETVFLMAADKWQFVSASFVKEIHAMKGDVSEFVTPATLARLNAKV
ncbi:MAG: pantetheine-phosphate adenylyltransferase [Micavibrio aeruginosavorus]|uniref:Phosphopantetheine adenylyltransferase n=1 Tax=Micavibrio aeruginosavorus TaxID=349221 RepID=A0A2W4ZP18_9BACT|nr:MAG: pantetheine-phosphate adenylyltransferase [Micavibrio aeruginosavorus]